MSGLKWLLSDHQGTEIAAVTAGNLAVASRRQTLSGWNDIVGCFTKGDVWACGGLVMNLVPLGKVGKVLEAGYKAVKAVASMAKVISKAQAVLRRVEKIAEQAAQVALNAMRRLGGKGASGCNSFMPGTKVLLADGSRKPIEQVNVGDEVWSTDPETGQSGVQEVVGTIIAQGAKNLVEITVDTDGAAGDATGKVTATEGHPFWLPEQHAWVVADAVKVGAVLQTAAYSGVEVISVRKWTAQEHVHNLTVDNVHTYYVEFGSIAVLNHNTGGNGHICQVSVTAPDGSPKLDKELESGDMTAEEASLGFFRTARPSHTHTHTPIIAPRAWRVPRQGRRCRCPTIHFSVNIRWKLVTPS